MPAEEKLTLARWIDLGAPIDLGTPWGFLEDDLRPTLVLRPSTAQARTAGGIDALEISAFDTESGVVPGSLTVTCNLRLGSFAPGANLAAGKADRFQGGRPPAGPAAEGAARRAARLHRERARCGGAYDAGGADVQGSAAGGVSLLRQGTLRARLSSHLC